MGSIRRVYIRHYRDNDQTTAYVEWADGERTEGPAQGSIHMNALFACAIRQGLKIEHEMWS